MSTRLFTRYKQDPVYTPYLPHNSHHVPGPQRDLPRLRRVEVVRRLHVTWHRSPENGKYEKTLRTGSYRSKTEATRSISFVCQPLAFRQSVLHSDKFERVCGEWGGGYCSVRSNLNNFEHVNGGAGTLCRGEWNWGPTQGPTPTPCGQYKVTIGSGFILLHCSLRVWIDP